MGAVYKANDPALDRTVAIKVLPGHLAGDADFTSRFKREAMAAAKLNHPNVVQVYAAGEDGGTNFIAMEFVDGESLQKRLFRVRQLDVDEALAITLYVADALRYAWNKAKIIHRDIKPDNILLSSDGEVKLTDLGLAKSLRAASVSVTSTGTIMGSAQYISREQARGQKDVDFRSDIYSLGCTLYHMLTGRVPYEGEETMGLPFKHVHEPPPDPTTLRPDCPPRVAAIVLKMMAKNREQRHASYDDLICDLTALHAEATGIAAAPAPAPTVKPAAAAVAPTVAEMPTMANAQAKTRKNTLPYVIGSVVVVGATLVGLLVWSPWKKVGGTSVSRPAANQQEGRGTEAAPTFQNAALGTICTNAVGAEMVYIPPGEFMLGSTKEERAWIQATWSRAVNNEGESPCQATIRNGFWMGRTEVTVGQWKQFITATGYKTEAEQKGYVDGARLQGQPEGRVDGLSWRNPGLGTTPQDNHPVTCVSWNDATAFCAWLTERERKEGRLPAGHVVRLPTEAEWEYACRAGTETKFWWGDAVEDGKGRLNWRGAEDGFEWVAPVDSFGKQGRNKFGLADMLGNVREWCLDNYDPKQAHEECYKGKSDGRVLRGGGFSYGPDGCRCASRHGGSASSSSFHGGFRVCAGVDAFASTFASEVFVKEVAALPAEEQVKRVVAELKRFNPGYDGKETHKIEGGQAPC